MCHLLKLELNEVQIKKFKNLCSLVKQVVEVRFLKSIFFPVPRRKRRRGAQTPPQQAATPRYDPTSITLIKHCTVLHFLG